MAWCMAGHDGPRPYASLARAPTAAAGPPRPDRPVVESKAPPRRVLAPRWVMVCSVVCIVPLRITIGRVMSELGEMGPFKCIQAHFEDGC